MKTTFRPFAVMFAGALLALAGCSTSHPGAKNKLGSVEATLAAPPSRVAAAAEQVLQDMNIPIVSAASTAIDGKVVGETARDKRVTITIDLMGAESSTISIRHGAFGDAHISVTILERIEAKLGLGSTATMDPSLREPEPQREAETSPPLPPNVVEIR